MPKLKPCCIAALALIAGGFALRHFNKSKNDAALTETQARNKSFGNLAIAAGLGIVAYKLIEKQTA